MIKEEKCFSATCDGCKDTFIDGNYFSIFSDVIDLKEKLNESEWTNENGELLCFNCTTNYENEDKIQDLKVEPLKKVNNDN